MSGLTGAPQLEARLRAVATTGTHGLMRKLATETVRQARILVPRKTSNLSRSIQVASVSDEMAVVRAGANYAAYVEYGTKAHEIAPNAKKALRWAASSAGRRLTGTPTKAAQRGANGGVVFATRVHHPGTRPHPYMLPGAKAAVAKGGLKDVIVGAWNGAA